MYKEIEAKGNVEGLLQLAKSDGAGRDKRKDPGEAQHMMSATPCTPPRVATSLTASYSPSSTTSYTASFTLFPDARQPVSGVECHHLTSDAASVVCGALEAGSPGLFSSGMDEPQGGGRGGKTNKLKKKKEDFLFNDGSPAREVGPGRYCPPRHRMPFNSRSEGLKCFG